LAHAQQQVTLEVAFDSSIKQRAIMAHAQQQGVMSYKQQQAVMTALL